VGRAGLAGYIHIEKKSLGECGPESKFRHGLVVVNPPYGERLGEYARLPVVYRDLGRWLKHCLPGWDASVLTAIPEMGYLLAMRAHRMHKVMNGAIPCTLLHFHINEIIEKATKERHVEMFVNRLKKNLKTFRRWREKEGVSCYRVYDADLPEYALAIDVYQGERKMAHVQEYAPPRSVNADHAQQRLLNALAELPDTLDIEADDIYFKVRQSQKGDRQYQKQAQSGEFFTVEEYGCKFFVNLSDYLDTGLFLDHRNIRRYIQQHAAGKSFLNLFAYTGSATVHAAKGGASSSTTVDMSRTYLDWAQRNMELNGFRGSQHRFIRTDVVEWVRQEAGRKQFDLVFLDPPSFSNSSSMQGTLDIQRDHAVLIRDVMRLVAGKGCLIFSNNLKRFRLDETLSGDYEIEDITRESIPRDFERHKNVHHCWLIRHR
jgi:23S rRNA (guanine2445-N2)-methyltransferase / 23S rRNA (guanine2069-N7)-methyltransferase